MDDTPTFYEFFAGGGMARAGLGASWRCLFANDHDPLKAKVYADNWGCSAFDDRDVRLVEAADVPGRAVLAWASFPCQDLSVAGGGRGLGLAGADPNNSTRSGAFWPFLDLLRALGREKRAPGIVVLENVLGLLTANEGRDFAAVASALAASGHRFGALVVDAKHFLPQSRPRVFVVATRQGGNDPSRRLSASGPRQPWHTEAVARAQRCLPPAVAERWVWWDPGQPPRAGLDLSDVVLEEGEGVVWNTAEQTARLLSLMSDTNLKRVEEAKRSGRRSVGSVFLRMRPAGGVNVQRAEVSFSPAAGCLRTPRGGASRPRVLVIEGERVRSRLLSPREAAVLMGLPPGYALPPNYDHAFRVIGDGVVVPVVAFLRERLLDPLVGAGKASARRAA